MYVCTRLCIFLYIYLLCFYVYTCLLYIYKHGADMMHTILFFLDYHGFDWAFHLPIACLGIPSLSKCPSWPLCISAREGDSFRSNHSCLWRCLICSFGWFWLPRVMLVDGCCPRRPLWTSMPREHFAQSKSGSATLRVTHVILVGSPAKCFNHLVAESPNLSKTLMVEAVEVHHLKP